MHQAYLTSQLFGPSVNTPASKPHTIKTLLPEMEQARLDLEAEIMDIEKESAATLENLQGTIGDLSDLRYGRLRGFGGEESDLAQDVIDSLKRLERMCDETAAD